MGKQVEDLRVSDLQAHPVWQYSDSDDGLETSVMPVKRIPVTSLLGKLVGTTVTLANGKEVWAVIGNVDEKNPRLTQHFLTLSVECDGRWFVLARYHDFNRNESGPTALAKFLKLPVDEIFPIKYDIRGISKGKTEALVGYIRREPLEKLSREQIISLAVP